MASISYAIRTDEKLKSDAARVADYFGFDLASVTRAFWKQMVRTQSIPLSLRSEEPNDESLRAIRETEEIVANGASGYATVDDMFGAMGM